MTADLRLLPPSIQDDRFKAFAEAIDAALSLPLSVLAIYDIDSVDVEALPHLAEQFNVLGKRGWTLADTEAKQRALISAAIELHRHAGTPWAVRTAMATVGYPGAVVQENPPLVYDGSWEYNGWYAYDAKKWNTFIVVLDPVQSKVSGPLIELIIDLINEWKNARSFLIDLRIGDISLFKNLLQYDGLWSYDGAQEYDGLRNIY